MKKIITLLALFVSVSVVAQQPAPVKVSKGSMAKFQSLYPNAQNVDWTQGENGKYIAHFVEYSKNRWITIDEKNDWSNSLLEIDRTDLPKAADNQLTQYFGDRNFLHYYKYVNEANATHFEADFETGEYLSGLIFDMNGYAFNKTSRLKNERPTRVE